MDNRTKQWAPLAVFFAVILNGALLGPTDDEAYYWVLAQKFDLSYAYHPPLVAWMIALSQLLFGKIFGPASTIVLRLPAALAMALITRLVFVWLESAGVRPDGFKRAGLVLLSFAGLTALSWMMVPDVPLFLGWSLAFVSTWMICKDRSPIWVLGLAAGIAMSALAKYSGVMVLGSACLAVIIWAPREKKGPILFASLMAFSIAMIPILYWNAEHEWSSILYQVRDRQGGDLSIKRYLRFWAIELAVAGPVLVAFALGIFRRARACGADGFVYRFAAVWILPALIYLVQPLWADFKPHWAFIVWWPAAWVLALEYANGRDARRGRFQIAWGLSLLVIVTLALHFPVLTPLIGARSDVTNDLHGWRELARTLKDNDLDNRVVLASRYQTASQAAFALADVGAQRVSWVPREERALDEWPELAVTEKPGPEWPRLLESVVFVSDSRYDSPPEFKGAACAVAATIEAKRMGLFAKRVDVWRCDRAAVPNGTR